MPDPGTWDGQGALGVTAFASRGCFPDLARGAIGGGGVSTATKIEWTRADDGTAGDVEPGDRVHEGVPGCEHCYAETFAQRAGHPRPGNYRVRLTPGSRLMAGVTGSV